MDDQYVCGVHAVLAALKTNAEHVEEIWVSDTRGDRRIASVLDAARAARVKVHKSPRAALDRLADGVRHQGVVARLRATPVQKERDLESFLARLPPMPLLLVLDGVQDPHNLGACLRSADAAGVHAVIVPREHSAPLSAVARRAASGAAETVPVFQVVNLARTLRELKQAGLWLAGASQEADTDVFYADLRRPLVLVLGGEGKGLRRLTQEECDMLVRIPMAGTVESLNVSVAAGVCLFEAVRQRSAG
ncbi:MAG: 23S rRNA (guanosine(2251)-2'-O)-methyltransferase RlmB [Gammaproteobacteria bacterium]|nr:23S rRNA (guanosine(2251)-2'-O)-methyltransferase RlmB [Gammaproteobacteria bacterium]MDH3371566.1 23S rRNA (guanosine(2251)-2'-O)-methyltransferase RlmB [Gammaproteobacteria bacterium]MDH3405636.1 23S rRNA (guanosine(2251)-2'-O)-methyltransferase RlmB [Gammaproteobacteria bacterium]MDH3563861.1 23S rRNA (guanosine(2251)-2'-O)-methyltransferase RlmB [Gammaproteobacteria bacterium]MDH5487122.1 23S rRNA (guanosine(2251)-2'-O)-methyltransferase RlmB [Gammaproteobacteria bacterium]